MGVQSYVDADGWVYMEKLRNWTDAGMNRRSFIHRCLFGYRKSWLLQSSMRREPHGWRRSTSCKFCDRAQGHEDRCFVPGGKCGMGLMMTGCVFWKEPWFRNKAQFLAGSVSEVGLKKKK